MRFLILQHLAIEPPGLIADMLKQAGHSLTTVHLNQGDRLPDAAAFDAVIVMGGSQSANDRSDFIQAELAWLQDAIFSGMPMLGICLGAQLMAKASGAVIMAAPVRELGWHGVRRTEHCDEDALFCAMPDGLHVFQWHGETFSQSDSMLLMATHPDVPAQAFRLGNGQYGLQFHLEVDAGIIDGWLAAGDSERSHLGENGVHQLRMDTMQYLEPMRCFCRELVQHWLAQMT